MAKINQEEYELLKSIGDNWKWITRDEDSNNSTFPNELWLYEYTPEKGMRSWFDSGGAFKRFNYDNIFQFIRWEDIEPYSIDYLVLEYESENLPQPPVKEQTEKVEVPQFVFDWIEESKDFSILEEISYLRDSLSSQNMREEHEIYFWLKNNFDTFAKAWLDYPNIEVENPKYYALIKGHEHIQGEEKYWNYDEENETLEVGRNRVQDDVLTDYTIQASLSEWEDLGINEDNAEFVKVEGRQLTCQ